MSSKNATDGVKCTPFVRWAGGKKSLAQTILSLIPSSFDNSKSRYFEPFVGGGAVALALSERIKGSKLVINDTNPDLISTYNSIINNLDELVKLLKIYSQDFSLSGFNAMRLYVPKNDLERAARFIYLNKTCFNGLWRVNSSGNFNVPYGKLSAPNICDEKLLTVVSTHLQGCTVRHGSYIKAVADAKKDDFVYFDPPYIPLNPTSSFSRYSVDDFTEVDHWALAGVIRALTSRGVNVILSNSDTSLTRQIFKDVVELRQVSMSRSISAAAGSRNRVNEVLGVNFKPSSADFKKLVFISRP